MAAKPLNTTRSRTAYLRLLSFIVDSYRSGRLRAMADGTGLIDIAQVSSQDSSGYIDKPIVVAIDTAVSTPSTAQSKRAGVRPFPNSILRRNSTTTPPVACVYFHPPEGHI